MKQLMFSWVEFAEQLLSGFDHISSVSNCATPDDYGENPGYSLWMIAYVWKKPWSQKTRIEHCSFHILKYIDTFMRMKQQFFLNSFKSCWNSGIQLRMSSHNRCVNKKIQCSRNKIVNKLSQLPLNPVFHLNLYHS